MNELNPPPSYEASSYKILWPVVASYVSSRDLLAACLVSHEWHDAFAPQLWGNPATRFEQDIDEVHSSLSRFRYSLPHARLAVRALTHTLEFSKQSLNLDFSENVQNQWLRQLLDYLPGLRNLIIPSSCLINHQSLMAVHLVPGNTVSNPQLYSLKSLDLSGNYNLTSQAVVALLQHLPELIYLDLASWSGVRQPEVLSQIGTLRCLKVLRLGRCGLKDEDMKNVVLPRCLLSLDISFCRFTRIGLDILLEKLPQDNYEAPPAILLPRIAVTGQGKDIYSGNLGKVIMSGLKAKEYADLAWNLPISFCELNLEGNEIAIEDIIRNLRCATLDHMDCRNLHISTGPNIKVGAPQPQLGSQHLHTPLFTKAFQCLRSLRIHHALVTDHLFTLDRAAAAVRHGDNQLDSEGDARGIAEVANNSSSTEILIPVDLKEVFRQERGKLLKRRARGRFQPSMLPSLKILALTDMPSATTLKSTINSFTLLIQELSEEENWARLGGVESWYRPLINSTAWLTHPKTPLRMQKLILEMAADDHGARLRHNHRLNATQHVKKLAKSSVEDPDAESFLSASEGDFSFFREDGHVDKSCLTTSKNSFIYVTNQAISSEWMEIIPAIAKFRKESKSKYEVLSRGESPDCARLLAGHWIGEIQVLRKRS